MRYQSQYEAIAKGLLVYLSIKIKSMGTQRACLCPKATEFVYQQYRAH